LGISALAAPDLLGKDECTYGPSYWCSQISKAKKCGAVQHCMQTVWKNQIIKPKDVSFFLYKMLILFIYVYL
jgi:hypothetical protein